MKSKFSTSWKASKQVRKQRKYRANAPLHLRKRFLSSNLSKELRQKYGRRNVTLRKGDKVTVMRGSFHGKTGKVGNVNFKRTRITIEGIQRQKKDGTKINVYFHPSKVQIIEVSEGKNRNLNINKEKQNAPQKK
jgi:large subunit ribosomal protein L24